MVHETYSERKDQILNALIDRRGLQYLTDVAAKVFNNPIYIQDVSGKILAMSQAKGDQKIWEKLFPEGFFAEKSLVLKSVGDHRSLIKEENPFIGQFSHLPAQFLACGVRDKDGVVAFVTIVERKAFCDEDSELLIVFCKSVLFEILYHERTAMQTIPYFGILKDIIESTAGEGEIRERCRSLHLEIPESMRLLGIKIDDQQNNSLSLFFLRETLLSSIPSCFCIIYDDSLIVIIAEKHYGKTLLNKIQSIFSMYQVRIGVSSRFTDILEIKGAFQEMQAIQSIFIKLRFEKSLIFYEDVLLYHFMELASKEYDLNRFCLPVVKKIEEYDKQNGTFLKNSLEAYLEAGRNIQKAADRMYLHKNTLYYRLKRAEQVFDLDLNDENFCFNLQFSLRMKRMVKRL
ncbi:helix-turn-helix domain-containing protein [Eubacteriaceae bacterium ES2]|nr:helix-turn-helix domain-containing protein [Eubacteriaceae bacterium ES2]